MLVIASMRRTLRTSSRQVIVLFQLGRLVRIVSIRILPATDTLNLVMAKLSHI